VLLRSLRKGIDYSTLTGRTLPSVTCSACLAEQDTLGLNWSV